jgi:hypothetical protein
MEFSITRKLGVWVVLAALTSSLLGASALTARSAQARQNAVLASRLSKTGQRFEAREGRRPTSRKLSDKLGWLLEPRTFNMLSSGGQRGALLANGLLPLSRRPPSTIGLESSQTPQQAVAFQNVLVDNPADDVDGHTHSETSIAVNGSTIVEAFNDASNANGAGYAVSNDGGNTWTAKRIPTPAGGGNLSDPVVVFGPNGELYYSILSFISAKGGFELIVIVAKSTDSGQTFSTPVNASTTAANANDTQDKPWTAVDKGASSPFKGHVYVSWTDFTSSGSAFINVAHSSDGGATFSNPVAVSSKSPTTAASGSMAAVAPNGDLYVAYEDFGLTPGGISIVKSTDGGVTFSPPKTVSTFFPIAALTGGNTVRVNSFPRIVVDGNSNLHIVFNAITHFLGPDRSDVYYVRSIDGGNTFTNRVMLNDDQSVTSQWFPCIAVAADGTLGVRWWDRRNDPTYDRLTDVYMTVSHDGGTTWSKNFRVTDHNWVFGPVEVGLNAGYHGDYDDIAADGNNFYVSFSDERGIFPNAYFAFVPINQNPAFSDFNISANKVYDSVIAGNSTEYDFNTSAFNGFSGSLNLSVVAPSPGPALPSGVTFSFASNTITAGSTAKLTVSTSNSVQPGTYLISVAATGGGLTRSTNFRLTVYDPGRTASNPINATNTPGFSSIQDGIQIDSSGIIHLGFDDDTTAAAGGSDAMYSRSSDGGHSFSQPVKVSTNSDISFNSTLTLDGSGNIYIAWTTVDQSTGNGGIFVSRSTDHGLTFSTPVIASSPTQDADFARISVDKSGNILPVFIVSLASRNPSLFAARSTNGGASFSPPVQISGNSQSVSTTGASVAFDSAGVGYIVYSDTGSTPVALRLAIAPDGQRFGSSSIISDGQKDDFAPDITIDKNGAIYVAFYSRFDDPLLGLTRDVELIKSCDKGGTFSGQVNISNNPGQSVFPSIVVDSEGVISVAWEDNTDNDQGDIFFSSSTDGGATFHPSQNLSANSGASFGAAEALDPNGNVFIGWSDDSTAEQDVLLCTVAAAPPPKVASGFGLVFNPTQLTLSGGEKGTIEVFISRVGGFSGNVTVSPVNAGSIRMKIKPGSAATTCLSTSFSFKLKGSAPPGAHTLTFSGTDDKGNTQTGNLTVNIQ